MSIYPVRIKEWYTKNPEDAFSAERMSLKDLLRFYNCKECGKRMRRCWYTGYVHHSITWGYGDAWCSKKCLNGEIDD